MSYFEGVIEGVPAYNEELIGLLRPDGQGRSHTRPEGPSVNLEGVCLTNYLHFVRSPQD